MMSYWRGIILAYVAINMLVALYLLFTLPAFGWDTLSFWAPKVIDFVIDYNNAPADAQSYSIRQHRHPPAAIWMQSKAIYIMNGNVTLSLLLPLVIYLSVVFFIHDRLPTIQRLGISLTSVVISLSTAPLLANHLFVHGYTEVYVGASVLLALALWQRGFRTGRSSLYFAGAFVCAFIPLALKNTGVLYTVAVLVSFLVASTVFSDLSRMGKTIVFASVLFALVMAVFLVAAVDWNGTWMGSEFSNNVASRTLWFGGYPIQFTYVGFMTVLRNSIQTLFINQSFGILGLAYVMAFCFSATSYRGRERGSENHFIVLAVTCAVATWAAFTVPQLFSERVNAFSAPGMDTGYSRFLIPVAMLLPAPLAVIYNQLRVQPSERQ